MSSPAKIAPHFAPSEASVWIRRLQARPIRRGLILQVLGLGLGVTVSLVLLTAWQATSFALCLLPGLVGVCLTIWITSRMLAEMERQARTSCQVPWDLVDAHEKVARRFAHEMHEEIAQTIAGVRAMLRRTDPQNIDRQRPEILAVLTEMMEGVTDIAQLLRPVVLDDLGLSASLEWLAARFQSRVEIPVWYESDFNGRLPEPVETHLFRIAQDTLANIAKHAQSGRVWMHLNVAGEIVRLRIEVIGKVGRGFPPELLEQELVAIRARLDRLQGELIVENLPDGPCIRVVVPMAANSRSCGLASLET